MMFVYNSGKLFGLPGEPGLHYDGTGVQGVVVGGTTLQWPQIEALRAAFDRWDREHPNKPLYIAPNRPTTDALSPGGGGEK